MLNPLKRKPEHRAGLLVASAAGAAIGNAIGFARLNRAVSQRCRRQESSKA